MTIVPGAWGQLRRFGSAAIDTTSGMLRNIEDFIQRPRQHEWVLEGAGGYGNVTRHADDLNTPLIVRFSDPKQAEHSYPPIVAYHASSTLPTLSQSPTSLRHELDRLQDAVSPFSHDEGVGGYGGFGSVPYIPIYYVVMQAGRIIRGISVQKTLCDLFDVLCWTRSIYPEQPPPSEPIFITPPTLLRRYQEGYPSWIGLPQLPGFPDIDQPLFPWIEGFPDDNFNLNGYVFYSNHITNDGYEIQIPEGWIGRLADNGEGYVYQALGASGNSNMIRIMNPTAQYPNGYVRYYNEHGQPLDIEGKPGNRSSTHIPVDEFVNLDIWLEFGSGVDNAD